MAELNRKLGAMEFDGLIIDVKLEPQTDGAVIRKIAAASGAETDTETSASKVTIKRGTILAKSSTDNKLIVLGSAKAEEGETLEAYGILCDDTIVGADKDVPAVIYTAGSFNANKVIVADDYEMTDTDYDTLRKYNIVIKSAMQI